MRNLRVFCATALSVYLSSVPALAQETICVGPFDTHLELNDFVSNAIAMVGGLLALGAVIVSVKTFQVAKDQARKQNTLRLYEQFQSLEFYDSIRATAWKGFTEILSKDVKGVVGYDHLPPYYDIPEGKNKAENGKTISEKFKGHGYYRAINVLAGFFDLTARYAKVGWGDEKLTKELFGGPWSWFGPRLMLYANAIVTTEAYPKKTSPEEPSPKVTPPQKEYLSYEEAKKTLLDNKDVQLVRQVKNAFKFFDGDKWKAKDYSKWNPDDEIEWKKELQRVVKLNLYP